MFCVKYVAPTTPSGTRNSVIMRRCSRYKGLVEMPPLYSMKSNKYSLGL
jgi:hypothetical protein